MNIYFIFSMLFLKIYLAGSSPTVKYSYTEKYIIKAPNRKNIVIENNDIGCYNCITKFVLDKTFAYNIKPLSIKSKKTCINTNNTFDIASKAYYSCAITSFHYNKPEYDSSIILKEKTIIALKFSAVKNTDCIVAKQQQNPDIICLESSCKKIIHCCNEKNYCNTPERFNLLRLVAYTDKKDENFNNSYTKYTDSKCQLNVKSLADTRYQECLVVTNSSYIANNYTSTDDYKSENSLIIIAYILPPIVAISLIITSILVYKKIHNKRGNVKQPKISNDHAIELS